MPVITIQPGKERVIQTPELYLSILLTNGPFTVSAPEFRPLAGKSSRVFPLENISQVVLTNTGTEPVDIEYEQSNIPVRTSGGGSVSIENEVTVKEIKNAIPVNVAATVENVKLLPSSVFDNKSHVNIPSKGNGLLIAANDVTNRKVTIQVISEQETPLFIGKNNSVDASNGMRVTGSKEEPGVYIVENTAALYAYNDGLTAATVAIAEEYRP